MNEKNKIFSKLLTIEEMFDLYERIGNSLITRADIESQQYNYESMSNSISLLSAIELITFEQGTYKKVQITGQEISKFANKVYTGLFIHFTDIFEFISNIDLLYDEYEAKFYTFRNYISLDLSGLIMILDGIGAIELRQKHIYINDKRILKPREKTKYKKQISIQDLKEQLIIFEVLGEEAEITAMEFEKKLLNENNINKMPERISIYDVNAGYDIVSYLTCQSTIPDKFIEVKSCADDSWRFYISKNELEVAKMKKDNYFLYLYNRNSNTFRVIRNPFSFFIDNIEKEKWAIESQVYQIHSIEKAF